MAATYRQRVSEAWYETRQQYNAEHYKYKGRKFRLPTMCNTSPDTLPLELFHPIWRGRSVSRFQCLLSFHLVPVFIRLCGLFFYHSDIAVLRVQSNARYFLPSLYAEIENIANVVVPPRIMNKSEAANAQKVKSVSEKRSEERRVGKEGRSRW